MCTTGLLASTTRTDVRCQCRRRGMASNGLALRRGAHVAPVTTGPVMPTTRTACAREGPLRDLNASVSMPCLHQPKGDTPMLQLQHFDASDVVWDDVWMTFERDGGLVVEGFLEPDLLARLIDEVAPLVGGHRPG